MRGIRFYAEYKTTYAKRHHRNPTSVFAAYVCNGPCGGADPMWEGAGAVYDWPNSACCGTSASWAYLRTHCRRVSEAVARAIHPQLFAYLNQEQ